jgi:hypothetical protein
VSNRRWLPLLAVALLAALPRGAVASEPPPRVAEPVLAGLELEEQAEVAFLEHLGWRFERDPRVGAVTVAEGMPCQREDLRAAHASGDLVVRMPAGLLDADVRAQLRALLPLLADGRGSRCAWQLRVHPAVAAATAKLSGAQERGCYGFPKILIVNSPWFTFRGPQPEWIPQGPLSMPEGSPARAIEAVYARGGTAECFCGQLLAVYATQYELYGAEAFDRAFRAEDLSLGVPGEMDKTALGESMRFDHDYPWEALIVQPTVEKEDLGVILARYGPKAFSGLSGIVMDQTWDPRSNQNLVIVSVSRRANQILLERGGLGYVAKRCRDASERIRAMPLYASPAVRRLVRQDVDRIFAEPIFSEIQVYVHPFGVVPLGEIVRDETEENAHPVFLYVYMFGREDHYFQRYRSSFKDRWLDSARSRSDRRP